MDDEPQVGLVEAHAERAHRDEGLDLVALERLLEALGELAGADADGIAAGVDDAVRAFQDDANDDLAIMVVQASPSGRGATR